MAVALTFLLACSQEDGSTASSSGIEGSKLLSSLSAPELDTVCRWFAQEEYEGLTADPWCLLRAVDSGSTKAICEAEADACRAYDPERRENRLAGLLANCEAYYVIEEQCKATVAQLELCVRDTFRLRSAFGSSLSCDEPPPRGSASNPEIEPASCLAVLPGCFFPRANPLWWTDL